MAEDESLSGPGGGIATDARLDHHHATPIESALAKYESGGVGAHHAGQGVGKTTGFDAQGKHHADVTDFALDLGRALFGGSLRRCCLSGRRGAISRLRRGLAQPVFRLRHQPVSHELLQDI